MYTHITVLLVLNIPIIIKKKERQRQQIIICAHSYNLSAYSTTNHSCRAPTKDNP